ncbi:divergent polysaccharide deacetylase family protein [Marinobacterium sp. D7]|uniref:divergent polysaccharide deacetylase family protein n=1 Tax=Marinobacterium ramblicola TaxID=2849041 RepID=UPI001C2CC7E8|nr:divergent polysaccharide deacetylase family protein [Marinobacterium ramblicola]MBV1787751.1 divergent polysaccharide deacetylase family protein [Marinobacterium ramblicola]
MKRLLIGLLIGLVAGGVAASEQTLWRLQGPKMVLIIDDLGTNLPLGQAALALPGPITYAVLPLTPHSRRLSAEAERMGKEVILHAPMANLHQLKLGPGALTLAQSKQQLQATLRADLDAVPEAIGINNHMGSLMTQRAEPMTWVMEVLRERGLFFIDSRTTAQTRAYESALRAGIPALERDVFLDNERNTAAIEAQFLRAVELAKRQGSVVVIGHPYPETVGFLAQALPALGEYGITLMSASAYLAEQQDAVRRQLARVRAQTEVRPGQ